MCTYRHALFAALVQSLQMRVCLPGSVYACVSVCVCHQVGKGEGVSQCWKEREARRKNLCGGQEAETGSRVPVL